VPIFHSIKDILIHLPVSAVASTKVGSAIVQAQLRRNGEGLIWRSNPLCQMQLGGLQREQFNWRHFEDIIKHGDGNGGTF
jgi:hypothetical protein